MDYQEAIYCMKVMAEEEVCEECNYYHTCDHTKQADMARIAISAMQELQMYKDSKLVLIPDAVHKKQCEELDAYKQIGTLEEVREAVEKQRAKKALLGGNTDKLTRDIRICPCCCGIVGMDDMRADYCADCGQAIDWSEENVR